jgi:predicted amidohydrolase
MLSPLSCALLARQSGHDIRANHGAIAAAIQQAGQAGARLLITPEAALTGCPEVHREDLEAIDWRALAALEDDLAEQALERRVVLVLGTASPWQGSIGNDALVCGAVDHERRYRARCLTSREERSYIAGEEAVCIGVDGWTIGLGISFDLRFPLVWAELALAGCDAFALLGHFAGADLAAERGPVIESLCVARAAEWTTPFLMANTSASDRWADSGLWGANGSVGPRIASGLLTAELQPRDGLPTFYPELHHRAMLQASRALPLSS